MTRWNGPVIAKPDGVSETEAVRGVNPGALAV